MHGTYEFLFRIRNLRWLITKFTHLMSVVCIIIRARRFTTHAYKFRREHNLNTQVWHHDHFFLFGPRGGVIGRPEFKPPYWYFAFFSDGFNIWNRKFELFLSRLDGCEVLSSARISLRWFRVPSAIRWYRSREQITSVPSGDQGSGLWWGPPGRQWPWQHVHDSTRPSRKLLSQSKLQLFPHPPRSYTGFIQHKFTIYRYIQVQVKQLARHPNCYSGHVLGVLRCQHIKQSYLEWAHERVINRHHPSCVVELSTVVWCREQCN